MRAIDAGIITAAAGALHEAGHDQGSETGSETAGGRRGDEADDADDERPAGAAAVTEGAGGKEQGGEHQRVAVHHPLQTGDPAAEVIADRWQRDVDHHGVERDDEEPEHRSRQRRPRPRPERDGRDPLGARRRTSWEVTGPSCGCRGCTWESTVLGVLPAPPCGVGGGRSVTAWPRRRSDAMS